MTSFQDQNDSTAAGANIMAAARVMRAAHAETSALMGLLDELMLRSDYVHAHVTNRNWVGLLQNGAQIGNPSNWMATSLKRAYLEKLPLSQSAIVFEVQLLTDRYAEPVFSTLALRFEEPVEPKTLWNGWDWVRSSTWQSGAWGDVAVPKEAVGAAFPRVSIERWSGRAIPLCSLEKSTVGSVVVDPALLMARSLASPASR